MAHKDIFTAPGERWKHLRPFEKRKQSKRERKAAKRFTKKIVDGDSESA